MRSISRCKYSITKKCRIKCKIFRSKIQKSKLFIIFLSFIIFLFSIFNSYGFINVFSTSRLVNYTIIFDVVNDMGANGKLSVITNKIPKTNEFQKVFNLLKRKYNFTILSSDDKVIKKYSTLINITSKMVEIPELNYYEIKHEFNKSNEEVCYNDLCGEKYDVLNYLASNFSSDDAFEFVCKINHFVHKFITYDKSLVDDQNPTITRILSVRRGVCVHYATLFNEIMKSIGLKSRIAYGFAKSSENDTQWDAHAWNEVYLGRWIPFDPTYDYCGLVDSMHIKLSNEPLKTTITFIGNGNVKFDDEIDINDVKIENKTFKFNISYDIRFEHEKINFDSDQIAYVIVKNNENTYAFGTLKIISTNKVKIPEDTKFIVLKPKETKVVDFVLKPEYFDDNYIYTIPVSVYDSWENTKMNSFVITKDGIHFKYKKTIKPKNLSYSLVCDNLSIFISKDFKVHQNLNCSILNKGYSFVSNIEVYLNASNEYYLIENRTVLLSLNDSEEIISNVTKLIDVINYLYFTKHKHEFSLIIRFKDNIFTRKIDVNILNYSIIQEGDCFRLNHINEKSDKVFIQWSANGINKNATIVCISEIKKTLMPINDFNVTIKFEIKNSKYVARKDLIVEVNLSTLEKIMNAIKAFFTWLFDFSGFEEETE